ncbi:hypothetical protein ILYODFUR_025883 [Ilyodon furcidens]|uniref:ADAM10 cysteine-rich domain-containing protein n=1 Tax=Ilyodon furcidens TaxID=33524 RepID=A0ABV0T088_9TELE
MCNEETDCQRESMCSGFSPLCPIPDPKENLTVCSKGTRVCLNGVCAESVCVKHGLQQCDCPGANMKEKCHMCCQQPGKPETCASTSSSVLSLHFQKKLLPLVGGAPCSGNQGYCDKFHVCRILDADGPIARLKNSFLHLDDFDDLGEWMKWVTGELVPISSSLWARGRVHPGQVASLPQGNTQTTMHTIIHTPKGNLE